MKLRHDCNVVSMRGKHLLTLPDGRSFEVNESFAFLWKVASDAGEFTDETLADAIFYEYGISPSDASAEAAMTIELWQQYSLIE
ncbi:MAG: hypothetical protein J6T02_00250 [Bacteroidales bacterium]|nr:hypothetical protein [Bacteroidales bacterium]